MEVKVFCPACGYAVEGGFTVWGTPDMVGAYESLWEHLVLGHNIRSKRERRRLVQTARDAE